MTLPKASFVCLLDPKQTARKQSPRPLCPAGPVTTARGLAPRRVDNGGVVSALKGFPMESVSSRAVRPSPRSRKPAQFLVLLRGRVLFTADSLAEAFAWRDGFGAGAVYELRTAPRIGGAA